MSKGKGALGPLDSAKRFVLDVFPWATHTEVYVRIAWNERDGAHSVSGGIYDLRLTRADLAGRKPHDDLRIICERLLRCLESEGRHGAVSRQAEGPGAPVGATGATVTQLPLPGM